MAKILTLHGPNLNLLGLREPQIYGDISLDAINARLKSQAAADAHDLECRQSNSESELVGWIQTNDANFIIINPAGFTHTSVAIRDALVAVATPFIEVHLSNIYAREDFRKHSYVSDQAVGVISGFGGLSYEFAYAAAVKFLNS